MNLGTHPIDKALTFSVATHAADTGAVTDADAVPAYRVYEDETGTAILTGNMAKLDDANTTGFYSEQLTLSAANGFEDGKSYTIYVSAAVSSTTGVKSMHFDIDESLENIESKIDIIDGIVDAIVADTGTDGVALSSSTIGAIADQVYDEAIADHTAEGSAGSVLAPIETGTAQAGGASTITLKSGAVATDDHYNNYLLKIVAGTGAGQSEYISDYVGSTKVATMATAWTTQPSSDSVYVIEAGGTIPGASAPTATQNAQAVWAELLADNTTTGSFGQILGGQFLAYGTAQAGGASSITLASGATATNDIPNYSGIAIIAGTGAGQSRQISDYVGSSKVATVTLPWTTQPSSDSVYIVTPLGVDAATVTAIATGVWAATRAANQTAGSFGERVRADMVQISGDTTAADNLESYCDGTTPQPVNVTQISGDVTAADNLESYCDGTTPQPVNAMQLSGDATAADNLEALLDGTGGVTLVGDITGSLSGSVGSVAGNVDGNVSGTVAELGTQAKADVNAEVLDVMATDASTQPGQGTPAANAAMKTQIAYLYKAWRNKSTQTATEYSLFNDDASTVDQKSTVGDDGTTFTRGEVATGP